MRWILLPALALLVAACGVDGPPIPPDDREPQPGISISGNVQMGIAGGSGGVARSSN